MPAGWLADRFTGCAAAGPFPAPLVGVLGGRGGAGASVLAASLALAAVRDGRRAVLVDAEPDIFRPVPGGWGVGSGGGRGARKPKRSSAKKAGAAASGDSVTSPMQGTIVKVAVEEGQSVAAGDVIVVLEAMKMEQPLKAHKAGTVTGLQAEVGATVTNGAVVCELKD